MKLGTLAKRPRLRSLLRMIDWSLITEAQWRAESDTQLAAQLGCTPANVGAARKRYGAPASPLSHGGSREGSGRKLQGDDDEMTTATINLTKRSKRALMARHKAAGLTWNDWALRQLQRED